MHALSQLSPRIIFLTIFLGCASLLGYAVYMQHYQGLVPCQLCVLQRYAFVAVAIVALLAALFNPRGIAVKMWGGLLALTSILGGGISMRQSWLQRNPPESVACGPDLDYMITRFPLSDLLPKLFQGEGDCAKVDWTLFSLSMAEWALICFAMIAAIGVWQIVRRRVA